MKLYFSRNYSPRLAVAVARFLDAPVELEFAQPLAPDQQARFLPLNPNLRLPILAEAGSSLWEADAIACRLSQMVGSSFWRSGAELPDMIRWLSWGTWTFVSACDRIHFERVTRRRYGLGPVRPLYIEDGLDLLAEASAILDAHLEDREWLLASEISYADFRMACVLPFMDLAEISLAPYPNISRWYAALERIDAWRDPFAELDAPPLPDLPTTE